MSSSKFSDEFKRDAVAQITERGYPVREVSERLGVSPYSLYAWKKTFAKASSGEAEKDTEIRRLKKELARVSEERDILKNGRAIVRHWSEDNGERVFRQGCKVRYAFVAEHRGQFSVRAMCRCLHIQPSGFYAWLKAPLVDAEPSDKRC